jgi:hypothetical protein
MRERDRQYLPRLFFLFSIILSNYYVDFLPNLCIFSRARTCAKRAMLLEIERDHQLPLSDLFSRFPPLFLFH